MKSHMLVGVILALLTSPAVASDRVAMLDISGISTLLMQDCGVTHRVDLLPLQVAANGPLEWKSNLAAPPTPTDLADFDRFAPLAFRVLATAPRASQAADGLWIGGNGTDVGPAFSSAVAAMGEFEFPSKVVRPGRSILDTMVVVRLELQSPQAVPAISLRGGAAAVAWHAAMIGTGREAMPRTSAN